MKKELEEPLISLGLAKNKDDVKNIVKQCFANNNKKKSDDDEIDFKKFL